MLDSNKPEIQIENLEIEANDVDKFEKTLECIQNMFLL